MKKIKAILGCIITIIMTIVMIYRLGILVRPTDTDSAFNAIDTFHSMPNDTIEVIGYGSSHM